jgi:hypothetical protein
MTLTQQDIDDFAPYHTVPKFKEGYEDAAAGQAEQGISERRRSGVRPWVLVRQTTATTSEARHSGVNQSGPAFAGKLWLGLTTNDRMEIVHG